MTKACSDRRRNNDFRLEKSQFRLAIRRKFFLTRMVRQCNRMSKEVVEATGLEAFKGRLDQTLGILV